MAPIETVDHRVVRDMESKALLTVDVSERNRSRAMRSTAKKTQQQFDELHSKMHSIEQLLQAIVNKGQ